MYILIIGPLLTIDKSASCSYHGNEPHQELLVIDTNWILDKYVIPMRHFLKAMVKNIPPPPPRLLQI